jgi:phage-related protein
MTGATAHFEQRTRRKIGDVIYVLDAFQKKSKKGDETPKRDLDRIRDRLKQAREHHAQQQKG